MSVLQHPVKDSTAYLMHVEDEMILDNKEKQNFPDGYLIKTIHHFAMHLIKKLKQLRKHYN